MSGGFYKVIDVDEKWILLNENQNSRIFEATKISYNNGIKHTIKRAYNLVLQGIILIDQDELAIIN